MRYFFRNDPKGGGNEEKPSTSSDTNDAGSSYETLGDQGSDHTNKRQ